MSISSLLLFFFFNDPPTTEIYTLSLHDALPIYPNHYFGMQGIWADYDNDGWPDLFVANDAGPNYLYRNKHDGTFEDVSLMSGTAVSGDGNEQGSMGVDFGDFDHDGKLDLFVTNFTQQPD